MCYSETTFLCLMADYTGVIPGDISSKILSRYNITSRRGDVRRVEFWFPRRNGFFEAQQDNYKR